MSNYDSQVYNVFNNVDIEMNTTPSKFSFQMQPKYIMTGGDDIQNIDSPMKQIGGNQEIGCDIKFKETCKNQSCSDKTAKSKCIKIGGFYFSL